ncbi:MAG TPA: hypothetical protein VLE73_05775 [Candidatus Saccharimonadales bacterium]|nr:hypothetical protein [Candidatus Saccharimonadales bacterium]
MQAYDAVRQHYKPKTIKVLFIAESPPPAPDVQSSRQFYYTDRVRRDDRLFANTIRALYPEAEKTPEHELEARKEHWLRRFQTDGYYMIEALEGSQEHEVTKQERQQRIHAALPGLLERVRALATHNTAIILIKSNVYDVASQPLRDAGFLVLNDGLVDYPGRFNQQAYREKVRRCLARLSGAKDQ